MWLSYGVDISNTLVGIENVSGGKTALKCPYCWGELIAKKGKINKHHFAHSGETCRMAIKREPRELPTLPLYVAFDIFLSGKELEQLKKLWHRHKSHNNGINHLEVLPAFAREKLLEYNQHALTRYSYGAYQFTDLGKIPVTRIVVDSLQAGARATYFAKVSFF